MLRRQSEGDEAMQAKPSGSSNGASSTLTARCSPVPQQWDVDIPTPTFWFTDDAAMQRARDLKFEDDA